MFETLRKGKLNRFLDDKVDAAQTVDVGEIATKAAYEALAVHIAASYISKALCKCEIKFYETGKENNKLYEYYLLNVAPNNNQCSSQFINDLVYKILTEPDGALVITSDEKLFIADSFQREPYPMKEDIFKSVTIENLTLNRSYKASEVMYFKLENENVKHLIDLMYQDYGTVISYAVDSFLKSHSKHYKMKIDADNINGMSASEYYKKYLTKQLKEFLKTDIGAFPEYRGYSLEEMKTEGQPGSGDEIVSFRKDIFEVAGSAYNIPKAMMDGNMNNIKDVVNSFITFACAPVATLIGDVITKALYPYEKWTNGNYARVDITAIPYQSIMDMATGAGTLIGNTILKPNEVRKVLGFDMEDEEFLNTFFVTKNNSKADDVMKGIVTESGKE